MDYLKFVEGFLRDFKCEKYILKIGNDKEEYFEIEDLPKLENTKDFKRFYMVDEIIAIIYQTEHKGYVPRILLKLNVELIMKTLDTTMPF